MKTKKMGSLESQFRRAAIKEFNSPSGGLCKLLTPRARRHFTSLYENEAWPDPDGDPLESEKREASFFMRLWDEKGGSIRGSELNNRRILAMLFMAEIAKEKGL